MLEAGVMSARDTLFGALAQCYVTIDGTRYNFAQAIKLEAKASKNKVKVPLLGSVKKGNKATTIEHTGSMTLHYNTSIMRQLMLRYEKEGIDTYFEIVVTNDDKTSAAGRQTTTLYDCNLDEIIVAKFDAEADEYMDEDVDFTFESWDMPEQFKVLEVMTAA